jgi:hypothetical protein
MIIGPSYASLVLPFQLEQQRHYPFIVSRFNVYVGSIVIGAESEKAAQPFLTLPPITVDPRAVNY